MIRISGLKLPVDYNDSTIIKMASKELNIPPKAITSAELFKRSVDARHKNDVHFIAAVDVESSLEENSIMAKCKSNRVTTAVPYEYNAPQAQKLSTSPIIVGAGPAGLFAGLILAQAGASPIIIERGKNVDDRSQDVKSFWNTGKLNTSSNVQFGEGGAGTFSDGKLNTGTKDKRARKVLTEFVRHGAPQEILYNSKPHIGTDKLPNTVKNIRNEIIALGGTVMFETTLTGLHIKDNKITGIQIQHNGSSSKIESNNVILAIGHSARDTFEIINNAGIIMEQKAFSVGVRIEHLQSNIDRIQYGAFAQKGKLGSADYKLAIHLNNGRGVYTFCMCPGGTVVAAASEENMLVTNGMSEFSRNKANANSALLVGVSPQDFASDDVLAGVALQRSLEKKAFEAGGGGYKAPIQRVGDFLNNVKTNRLGSVTPSYTSGYTYSNLHDCLPQYISQSLSMGIMQMNNRLRGFANYDAIMTGVETRSSSPIRILRNDNLQSVNTQGLYPCGEGAGYAGGIISAAVDGIKCAEMVLTR